jgi:cation:H+ antiporter
LLIVVFLLGAVVSLAASWQLVVRLERVGARVGLAEALLGMLAAVAADAPEITASVTALIGHQAHIGAGVALGSNLFNLAALLGLAALVGGRIHLHRRVVVLDGSVAVWVAGFGLLAVLGAVSAGVGFVLFAVLFAPYLLALSAHRRVLERVPGAGRLVGWVELAVAEAEVELEPAIHPRRGGARDVAEAVIAVAVVVGASVAMERAASTLGTRQSVPQILTGGLVLAGVTSVPNAVAGIYLARRGRGAATLSTALNSNAINVAFGLLLPGALLGLGGVSGPSVLVAACNVGLTVCVLLAAWRSRGLRRRDGAAIVAGYCAFVVALVLTAG